MIISLDEFDSILSEVNDPSISVKELRQKIQKLYKHFEVELRTSQEFYKVFKKHNI
jgi:hypothetical protein